MKLSRIGALLVGATAAVALSASTATAVTPTSATTNNLIVQQTGKSAAPLTTDRSLKAGDVEQATTPAGAELATYVQDRGAEGYSLIAVLERGQGQADFDLDLPAGRHQPAARG